MMNIMEALGAHFTKKLPVIFQSESSECGLACVCMIANYHGYKTDLLTLRQQCNISLKGASLSQIIKISDQLKLSSRAIRIELDDLKEVSTPCILHWKMCHFVVLKAAKKSHVVIHDPAMGEQRLSWEQVSEAFTGVALELSPSKRFEQVDKRLNLSLGTFLKSITGIKRSLLQIFLLAIAIQIFSLILPYFIQVVVDSVIVNKDKDLLFVLGIGFLLLTCVKVLTSTLRSWLIVYLRSVLGIQLLSNFFRHLMRLPLTWFEKRHVGDVLSRFGSLDKINQLLSTGFIEGVVDGLMALITLAMMCIYSVTLTCITLAAIGIYFIFRLAIYRLLMERTEESIQFAANEDSIFLESVRAIQTIKISNHESTRQSTWRNAYADWLNADIRLAKLTISSDTTYDLLTGIEYVLLVWVGALIIMSNEFSIGMLYAFFAYQGQFSSCSQTFINKFFEYKMISLHLQRVSEVILTDEEKHLESSITMNNEVQGKIELHNIAFKYSGEDPHLFKSLNLTIKAGECVAIVAPSGYGKTTLMKIMMGLLEPAEGQITIDGIDIKQFGMRNYRDTISAVMQNDVLLSGSVAQNISLFCPELDMNRVLECAEQAKIAEDILNMPMGFNTLVGDMGSTLSGGQMQRVLIARALYSQPKVLFLDEATSHLDKKSEQFVNDALKQLDMTRIIIAHREETIKMADRIIDLKALVTQTTNGQPSPNQSQSEAQSV